MADQWNITALSASAIEGRRGRSWDEPSLALGFSTGWQSSPSLTFETDVTYVPDMFPDNPIISASLSAPWQRSAQHKSWRGWCSV
ncbi:MAG: hypothetical protein LC753_14635 [Acidobacteria bacterium]|nr:hypothetical protein [Acidobacteriota bacterium]